MTKGVFRESVFLKINGGQLTEESAVDRRDIDAYMPACVNYAVEAGINIQIQSEGNRDISSLFYGWYPDQTILVDADRHNWRYIAYPKATIPLRSNQGIRFIEDGCGTMYKPLSDNAFRTIGHWGKILTGSSYYRPEKKGIYFFNAPPLITKIGVTLIVDCNALADTDELPIPAGLEDMALQKAYDYFMPQRKTPADRITDQRDLN